MKNTRLVFVGAIACLLLIGCGSSTDTAEPQTDDGGPPLNRMSVLAPGNPIPAGRWAAEIGGVNVEIRAEQSIDVSYDFNNSGGVNPDVLIYDAIGAGPDDAFFVVPFPGFVDGVDMRTPTEEDPLSSSEFFEGLDQAVAVSETNPSSIGGQDSIRWVFGDLDPDSPFACVGDDRSDLEADDLCTMWGADGIRKVQEAVDPLIQEFHYIENSGLIVAWVYADSESGDPFVQLADSLIIGP